MQSGKIATPQKAAAYEQQMLQLRKIQAEKSRLAASGRRKVVRGTGKQNRHAGATCSTASSVSSVSSQASLDRHPIHSMLDELQDLVEPMDDATPLRTAWAEPGSDLTVAGTAPPVALSSARDASRGSMSATASLSSSRGWEELATPSPATPNEVTKPLTHRSRHSAVDSPVSPVSFIEPHPPTSPPPVPRSPRRTPFVHSPPSPPGYSHSPCRAYTERVTSPHRSSPSIIHSFIYASGGTAPVPRTASAELGSESGWNGDAHPSPHAAAIDGDAFETTVSLTQGSRHSRSPQAKAARDDKPRPAQAPRVCKPVSVQQFTEGFLTRQAAYLSTAAQVWSIAVDACMLARVVMIVLGRLVLLFGVSDCRCRTVTSSALRDTVR